MACFNNEINQTARSFSRRKARENERDALNAFRKAISDMLSDDAAILIAGLYYSNIQPGTVARILGIDKDAAQEMHRTALIDIRNHLADMGYKRLSLDGSTRA